MPNYNNGLPIVITAWTLQLCRHCQCPVSFARNAVARRLDYSPQQVAATAAELGPAFPATRPISSGASLEGRASSSSCSFSLEDVEQMRWSVQRLSG